MRISSLMIAGPASSGSASTERKAVGTIGTELVGTEDALPLRGTNRVGSAKVPVRLYEPELAECDRASGQESERELNSVPWGTLVWAHGGSFVRGTLDWPEADWVAQHFAAAGLRVYSVDYALASDTVKAPAPAHDVAAVLREVRARHAGPVFVGGASAGGHLAVLAALSMADDVASLGDPALRPDALVLVYPTLHRTQRPDPALAKQNAKLPENLRFEPKRITEMYDFYLAEDPLSPGSLDVAGELSAERLAELPPTIIVNADSDDLRPSGEQFAEQLRAAGVSVFECLQPGTTHGYLNRPTESPLANQHAQATIDSSVARLRAILDSRELKTAPGDSRARPLEERTPAMEPALTTPASLTLPDGRLNRDAIGWATQPIIDTAGIGRGRGRNKRWEYWNVSTPHFIIGLTVSHIDYACVPEVWVYNRETGATLGSTATVIPPRGTVLAPTLEQGRSMARAKDLSIDIDEVVVDGERGTRLRCAVPGVSLDVVAALPGGHERLAVVVPWSDTRFQYTVKDVARPATGVLQIDGVEHEVGGASGEAWAVLDHGRGRWPYDIQWNWGAGSGRSGGRVIGVQMGAQWTEGTGVSENAFFVDGRMHKIHGETRWEYSLEEERWREPWRVTGGGLDATFTPFYNKRTRTDLLVLQGHTDQCFGEWAGSFETADGECVEFDGLIGWAEEVHNRW